MKKTTLIALKAGTAPFVLGLAMISTAASAQTAAVDCAATPDDAACNESSTPIVVTGSILRRTDTETASPVTTVTTESLDKRGISTIQDGLQRLAANNGPALTNSFSANGAFGAGASAISLRGLTTNSTLVLFDGMRAAYYPLADDGTRNFVDLNTIPDDIVERVEVLRDGASSSYGADAIAGVVNIITKREFQGVGGRAEAGISERGDAPQYRLSLTAGVGSLEDQGFNVYASGFYVKSDMLKNSARGYPFNTDDKRSVCASDGTCGPNQIINGLQDDGFTGGFGQATPFAVRPRNAATGGAIAGRTRYQLLTDCGNLPSYNPTAGELALPVNAASPSTVCQEDITNLYGVIEPDIERFGGSVRATAKVGDDLEVYGEFNFLQTSVHYTGLPATIRANAPAPFYFPRYSTSSNVLFYGNNTVLQLPVYVCAARVNCSTAADGQLNPNNPFAAEGYTAAILGRIPNLIEDNKTRTRAFRGALGVSGNLTDNITIDAGATAMHIDLQRTSNGYVYIQNLLNVIADGSFNFLDPYANSQQILDYVAPENVTTSTSDLLQAQLTLGTALTELSGGPLQLAVGGSIRYEAVDSPSANSDFSGGTQRYFRLNGFATTGSRTVYSTFAELNAPILEQIELNLSGRYDKYSTGPSNFSPKIGVKVRPIQQVLLRGTYSKGFRIPSFGEANATFPTTGYVNASRGIYENFFLNQYGCNNTVADSSSTTVDYGSCPTYVTGATYGQTSISNPNLQPEKSRSFTAGIFVEPIRNVSFAVDYYNIKKSAAIQTANNSPAIAAYYSGQAIPAGYTVIADAPDPNNPNALPRIAFVQAPFINATTVTAEGLDFSLNASFDVTDSIRWSSSLEASYILRLETEFPDGSVERYDGTAGNYNLTAGSGTPKWHGSWLNSLEIADTYELNLTANYFGGYDLSATDQGDDYKDCGSNPGYSPSGCQVEDYLTFDLGVRIKVNDRFTFSLTALNLADKMPPVEVLTYGAHLYNPVQGGSGILGRYFKAGVKVGF